MKKQMLFAPSGIPTDGRKKLGVCRFSFQGTAQTRISSLDIIGKTESDVSPSFSAPPKMLSLGEKTGGSLALAVHLHGRNCFDGYRFTDLIKEKIPSGTYTEDETRLYFSIPAPTDALVIGPNEFRFRERTSYTARIYMINTSGRTDCIQLAWLYTDGTSDPWINPEKNVSYNLYTATSDPQKTVLGVKHHYTSSERFTFSKFRFGIYEGVTVYDDATDYAGGTYPLAVTTSLRGFESGGVFVGDRIEAVSGRVTRKIRDAALSRSTMSSLGSGLFRILLTKKASIVHRDLCSNVFTPVKTAEEVSAAPYRTALSPAGDAILLSAKPEDTLSAMKSKLAAAGNHLYYVLKEETTEQVGVTSFTVPRENDGLEILSETLPFRTELLITN